MLLAALLIALAGLALIGYLALGARTLTIAAGPLGGSDLRVTQAFAQALKHDRAPIRLKLLVTDGPTQSAKAFEARQADLAIVRSDIAMPEDSATVAIIRRDAIYFIARPGLKVARVADLRGKNIGVVAPRPGNDAVLDQIFAQYGLAKSEVNLIGGTMAELIEAAQEHRIDAAYVIAPAIERTGRTLFRAFAGSSEETPTLLEIGAAEAMAEQAPVLDTVEIRRGAFNADPPVPEENTRTLAVTHRLVARRDLDEGLISELTRLLVKLRLSLVASTAAANGIELATTVDRDAKLPVHPGTIAFIEGETKTFFDRYGDWIYLVIMGASILGSVATALFARAGTPAASPEFDPDLRRLAELIEEMGNAPDLASLMAARQNLEARRHALVGSVARMSVSADKIAAIRFLLTELDSRFAEQRAKLAQSA